MQTAHPYHILPSDYKASSPNAMTPVSDRLHIGNIWLGDGGLNLYDNTARLHDPILLSYTSPDPNAFDYPGINPYTHCAANPANIIDPLGTDIYRMNTSGDILEFTENKDLVQFIIVADDGKTNYIATVINAKSDIMTKITKRISGGGNFDLYMIKNTNVAIKLFEFFANHTNVEWGHIKPKEGRPGNNYITTSHLEAAEDGLMIVAGKLNVALFGADIIHSHPGNNPKPSGKSRNGGKGNADIGASFDLVQTIYDKKENFKLKSREIDKEYVPDFYIYTPGTKNIIDIIMTFH